MKYYGIIKDNKFDFVINWDTCYKRVHGVKGVKYKSFTNYDEMIKWKNKILNVTSKHINLNKGFVLYSDGGSNTYNGKPRKKGSKRNNNDLSAWAYVITNNGKNIIEDSGFTRGFTNNQQELQGAYRGLCALENLGLKDSPVIFVTDSQYVINSLNYTGGYNINKPNINQVLCLVEKFGEFSNIKVKWVKGHDVTLWNNRCDELCTKEINKHMKR